MAYQIPNDLIKQLQISLRNEAKLSSYDPHDSSLPNLPSLHETIAKLDPSPPYLRCKHCKGRLLRDLKSFICVLCGKEQNTEVPPDPINFKNTIACRWLLESLGLDGSEMVGYMDLKESNRGKSAEEFPLTDLLDLKIRWPESEKRGLSDNTLAPSKSTLNLAEVDLDNYFSEENKDTTLKVSDEPLNQQIDGSESKTFQDNVDLSLFGNVQSSDTATRINEHESCDSFSGWEANFQTVNSATSHNNSKSVDPFAISGVDISYSLELTSGHQNKYRSGEIEETKNPSSSITSDWFQQQDDLWSSSNHETICTPEQVNQTGFDGKPVGTADYSSSASVDWFQDDQWQGGSKKKPDDNSDFEDDDSADAWDDFTSSTGMQGSFDNFGKDIVNNIVPKVAEISEIDFFGTTTSKDINFGNFSQPNLFVEAFPNLNGTSEEKATRPDASDLSWMSEENGKSGENSKATKEIQSSSAPSSNLDDVQMMMAKMHDLSFMLESHLSIPPK
ncbi:uncharacterized protein LOC111451112 [Cucurbita moschata]|uniref:Uncharacterized protein LOC111451112 n=1 Tax=Cucurbita moschata TaxID=3662 RepID=A0A6J1G5U6_CUCMO|nr:uncharacterized protein LOC111451112 [Cucurbita moschata]